MRNKKLWAAIVALLFATSVTAYDLTPILGLKKPVNGVETGWGPMLNDNSVILDNAVLGNGSGVAGKIPVWTNNHTVNSSAFDATDILTTTNTKTISNKTIDTSGGNVLKIGGVTLSLGGPSGTLATRTGSFTLGHVVTVGSGGDFVDGGALTTGTSPPFADNVALLKNNSDNTKQAAFSLASIPTATTRTYVLPNVNADTFVMLAATQTLTNKTYDTAGTGNVFKVNGQTISLLTGNTGTLVTFTGSHTTGNSVVFDASGNLIDAGAGSGDITDVWNCTSGNCSALTAASGDTLNAGSADSTIPNKTGTSASIPATCSVGQTYFKTDATAGLNTFACTATNTWTLQGGSGGSLPVSDATAIVQGSTTSSKQLRFEVDGFTASTTRVLTPPDANITLAGQDYANLFTAAQTLQAQNEQRFADADSSNYVGFKAPTTVSANKIWILPNTDSTGTQCLASDGSLNLSWTACSGGSGSPGGANTNVQVNNSGAFGGSNNWTYDLTNFRQRQQNATAASDGSAAMFQLSGTMPTSPSATVHGVNLDITSAGSASQANNAFRVNYGSGYSGSSLTRAGSFGNGAGGSGNTLNLGSSTGATANMGIIALASGAGTGANIGADLEATGSGPSAVAIGALAKAADSNAHPNIGVLGNAANSAETTNLKNVGIYGTLNTALMTALNGSYAGLFDGGTLPDAISRALRADATLPTSPSAGTVGVQFNIIGAGSASQVQRAASIVLNAGYTGSSQNTGLAVTNTSAGLGTTLSLNTTSADPAANIALRNFMSSTTTGHNIGSYSHATGSTGTNIGDYASANGTMLGTNIGGLFNAANSGETSDFKNVALYATLHSALVTGSNVSAAIVTDGAGSDLERGYNAATLKYRVGANGEVFVGNFTVSGLPSCTTSDKGLRATVTDANAACTFASSPTGGSTTTCPVYCDGSAWKEG